MVHARAASLLTCTMFLVSCQSRTISQVPAREIHERTLQLALLEGKATDFNLLSADYEIVVSSEDLETDQLPELENHRVLLLSLTQIRQRADSHGEFQYLKLTPVAVEGSVAKVAVLTQWAFPSTAARSIVVFSGGGMEFEFSVDVFDRLLGKATGGWIA